MPEAQKKMPIPWLKYDVGHSPQMHLDVFSSVTGTGMVFAHWRFMCSQAFLFNVMRASISLFAALEREKERTTDVECGRTGAAYADVRQTSTPESYAGRSRNRVHIARLFALETFIRCCESGAYDASPPSQDQKRTMKVLITGASGLLGSALLREASKQGTTSVAAYNSRPLHGGLQMDITQHEQVRAAINDVAPDYVIHAAAFTNVDACEVEPRRAWDINALGTKHVVDACNEQSVKVVYISTDFVFDGENGPYSEDHPTHPINVYGESKLAGERFTLAHSGNAVARVCVLYGPDHPNFVTWVIDSLRANAPINVVNDQYNTPTYVGNCARALLRMCELGLTGVYHVSGREQVNRYDFACAIADVFGLNEKLINVTTTDTLRQRARRPMNSSLSVEKAERALKMRLANVREGLTLLRDEWR